MREKGTLFWKRMIYCALGLLAAVLTACAAVQIAQAAQETVPAAQSETEAAPAPERESKTEPESKTRPERKSGSELKSGPEPEPEPVTYSRHTAYIHGENGYFFPERLLSRAEVAQLLVNLFGVTSVNAPSYADVPENAWYAPSVAAAADCLPGDLEGFFHPKSGITLQELLVALGRGMKLPDLTDEDGAAVAAARKRGWIDVTADPTQPITRAEAVVLLNRVLERTPDRETANNLKTLVFLDVDPSNTAYADILEATLDHDYLSEAAGENWSEESVCEAGLPAGLYKAGGYAKYVTEDGTVWTEPGLLNVGETTYLVSEGGQVYADMALHTVDGKVVFATAEGTLLKNGSWGQYQFDADGFYTSGDETLDTYVAQVLTQCTTEDMTQEEKLRACFEYVRAFRYLGRNATLSSSIQIMPMESAVAYANKIFETGKGDCYNFAASFCFLARALGYNASAVVGSCGYVWNSVAIAHGWVEITIDGETYLFDPEIENYNLRAGISNETHGAFQVTYESAPGRYYKN